MDDAAFRTARASTATPYSIYWKLAAAYALLLVYGTLFPFDQWDASQGGLRVLLERGWPAQFSGSDFITNLIVYAPLGLLLMLAWRRRGGAIAKITVIGAGGLLLSLGLEYLQSYLPARVASLFDTALNTTGTVLGALLAHNLGTDTAIGARLRRLYERVVRPAPLANLGVTVLGLWALSQLAPLVPSIDRGTLVDGIRPLLRTLADLGEFHPAQALTYAMQMTAVGLIAVTVARPSRRFLVLFAVFLYAVLLLKIPIVSRQLSLEALTGAAAALVALAVFRSSSNTCSALAAGLLVLLAYAIEQLHRGDPLAPQFAMNWIPFRGQMQHVTGFQDIFDSLWPFAALAYLVLLLQPRRLRVVAWGGALVVGLLTFALETMQARIPGRYPDITDVVLAMLGWSLPWILPLLRGGEAGAPSAAPVAAPRGNLLLAMVGAAGIALAGWSLFNASHAPTAAAESQPQLPAPEELAPVSLPNFRHAHPRLPAPSAAELARLRAEHPDFLRRTARSAAGKSFEAAIFMAYAEPGSQDLVQLHQKLMALQFNWRGHQQTKPIAMAYDWLYPQWDEAQRRALRDKLAEGCDYQIRVIRNERLSPYNVYLYNSPFQALMACAIALYGDHPRGDAVMAFTYDYWKNRVLPVWRQVMGTNGGWHEGAEYVGIGIGQAIYQLPAMWRAATGEDLFRTEPAIRGFLDFLVYRTRPDGTHFRWGDGGFFDRIVPDRAPLALEYRDAAAYSLRGLPSRPTPTSWPWGPLTDPSLYDPAAAARLPLTKLFDGLGLIVARSGWDDDATYVSFKAGDNYWSHTHLDQGAFTIYKGGALAIDSGVYGRYGSDHHFNYSYQTIAHNLVTVTDPADTVPLTLDSKKPPRPIANDGGQRRIGSGWGVAAPLDLADWQRQRDTYHTAAIEKLLLDEAGYTLAVADLTPAYTNGRSGSGTFADRTRRVEHYTRVFGYDRVDDVVVIFDRVVASKPEFEKRWLLHTLEQPLFGDDKFLVTVPATQRPARAGGSLEARVLLPQRPQIQMIGGPGQEFVVDGKNYGDGVANVLKRRPHVEAGSWRVEVMPPESHAEDVFLVVLLPTLAGERAPHQTRLLQNGAHYGVEIRGPHRTTRWWLDTAEKAAHIEEFGSDGSKRSYLARPDGAPR